jgi:hypothetical protein
MLNLDMSNTIKQLSGPSVSSHNNGLENWDYLIEEMELTLSGSFAIFDKNSSSINVKVSGGSGYSYNCEFDYDLTGEEEVEGEFNAPYRTIVFNKPLSNVTPPPSNVTFSPEITISSSNFSKKFSCDQSVEVKSFSAPTATISDAYYSNSNSNSNPTLHLKVDSESAGHDAIYKDVQLIELRAEEVNDFWTEFRPDEDGWEYIEPFNGFIVEGLIERDFIHIYPVVKSILRPRLKGENESFDGYSVSKTSSQTKSFVVYNVAPTVSYRQNLVGINSRQPETNENAVLVVNAHNNHNTVYLDG